jgi:hypothetical protein
MEAGATSRAKSTLYTELARATRGLASAARTPEARLELSRLADEYERLAKFALTVSTAMPPADTPR